MSRLFYHTMQDNLGNLLFGVSGTFRIAGTGTRIDHLRGRSAHRHPAQSHDESSLVSVPSSAS